MERWPVKKLLTDGKERFMDGGAWTGFFEMDGNHAEPAVIWPVRNRRME